MNKQQLIDKAIDDLGGGFPERTGDGEDGAVELLLIATKPSGWDDLKFNVGDYCHGWTGYDDKYFMEIGTREEFNNRKKEREMEEFKPKVGELCEVSWLAKVDWYKCVVSDKLILARIGERWTEIGHGKEVEFRPIQSEREKTLKYIDDKWREHNNGVSGSQARELFAFIYDTGMLKSAQ